jgi:hypothetical protein
MSTMRIDISKIRRDGGTQSREELNQNTVDEYAAAMMAGDNFPAVKAFYDGTWYWLSDGFHRMAAAVQIKATTIFADVRQGTQRDAILDSVAANSNHGLRRTREDMRRAIKTLLRDEEWSKWSDREIARKVNCDHKTVGSVRAEMASSGEIPQIERTVERNGTVYQMVPATKPMVTNSVGRGFEIGDAVRFSEQGIWEYSYGQIAAIDGEDVILNFAIKNSRAGYSKPETLTVSRLNLFPITQGGYQKWFCFALYEERVVLFAWKDHYIAFDVPMEANAGGHNWTRSDGDLGLAWRVHPAWLEHWTKQETSYVVVKQEDITPEMLDIVSRAGRGRGGKMVMPPQPSPEVVQSIAPAAPERPPLPEWAKEGNTVHHMSGKTCEIQSAYFIAARWMLRVEITHPKDDGFADAPLSEFGPMPNPKALLPIPAAPIKLQAGMKVLTRTGRPGEILEIAGRHANVKCKSYTHTHLIESLRIAPEQASVEPSPDWKPLLSDNEMEQLEHSLSNMVNFIESGSLPDKGDLSDDLERVYQAMHKARNVYYKMRDPATGKVKV